MQIHPYLSFKGDCEAAFTFYERCLGAQVGSLFRYSGTPLANQVPADWHDKVMHGSVTIGNQVLMGGDVAPESYEAPKGFSLSIQITSAAEAERIFQELARDGRVVLPLEKTFWAARFGMVVDRFGIPWLINCEGSDRPFHLRDATEADVPALATLHVQTFNETHCGGRAGGPSYEVRERQWRDAFAVTDGRWFCFVIEDDFGELIGFAKGTPHDGGVPGFSGELNKIYVLRRHHRQGAGRLLLCNVARRFLDRGVTSMLLFGEASNPSNGFYEKFGAERLYGKGGEFHGSYGWRDLHDLAARCG